MWCTSHRRCVWRPGTVIHVEMVTRSSCSWTTRAALCRRSASARPAGRPGMPRCPARAGRISRIDEGGEVLRLALRTAMKATAASQGSVVLYKRQTPRCRCAGTGALRLDPLQLLGPRLLPLALALLLLGPELRLRLVLRVHLARTHAGRGPRLGQASSAAGSADRGAGTPCGDLRRGRSPAPVGAERLGVDSVQACWCMWINGKVRRSGRDNRGRSGGLRGRLGRCGLSGTASTCPSARQRFVQT